MFLEISFLLIGGHYIADFPLQGNFLSKAKDPNNNMNIPWYEAMFAHCFIHGMFVAIITGIWWLGLLELSFHFLIDYYKCVGELTFSEDQRIHLSLKILWSIIACLIV